MPDSFEIADLLVRCSGVPLPRIASVLGFSELERFSEWFENRCGQHPEIARADWEALSPWGDQGGEILSATPPEEAVPDGPAEQPLVQLRRLLFSVLERRDMAGMIRAIRSRKPITTQDRR